MEVSEPGPEVGNQLELVEEDGVERGDVLVDVGAGLVHLVEQVHLLLDYVDDVIDVLSMLTDQVLLFLQDLVDQPLMVSADAVQVVPILVLQLLQ